MNEKENYLAVLGLKRDSSWALVKSTYRDLTEVWHPDRFAHNPRLQQDAQKKMKEINEAYSWLKVNFYKSNASTSSTSESQSSQPAGSEPINESISAKEIGARLLRTLFVISVMFWAFIFIVCLLTGEPWQTTSFWFFGLCLHWFVKRMHWFVKRIFLYIVDGNWWSRNYC